MEQYVHSNDFCFLPQNWSRISNVFVQKFVINDDMFAAYFLQKKSLVKR